MTVEKNTVQTCIWIWGCVLTKRDWKPSLISGLSRFLRHRSSHNVTSALSHSVPSLHESNPVCKTKYKPVPTVSVYVFPLVSSAYLTRTSCSSLSYLYGEPLLPSRSDAGPHTRDLLPDRIHCASTMSCYSRSYGPGEGDVGLNDVNVSECLFRSHRRIKSFFH